MQQVKSKGTILSVYTGAGYTAIAQVISLDLPEMETETYEADFLANTSPGIPYFPTGRTEGGKCSGELFFDPATYNGNGHSVLLTMLTSAPNVPFQASGLPVTTPAAPTGGWAFYTLTFANTDGGSGGTGPTTWNFIGAGFSLGGTVALKEGVKGKFSIKLYGLPTFGN